MAEKGLVTKSYLTATADAIRAKLGTTTKYKPSEFAEAIGKIGGGTDSAGKLIGYLISYGEGTYHVASIDADKIGLMMPVQALNSDTQAFIKNLGLGTYSPGSSCTVLVLTSTDSTKINTAVIKNLIESYGDNADFIYHENLKSDFSSISNARTYTFS